MKTIVLFVLASILYFSKIFAQVPQSFSYQAVVRDAQGNIIANQNVAFRFSIIQQSINGNTVYSERQTTTTNNLGLVNLAIGTGQVLNGNFTNIAWSQYPHFLKVELDIQGGTNYQNMGTTQLLSVPYAIHAQTAANVPTYSAGNGISINGNTITNTAPDQPISLIGQGATTVSGTYPNFTISSTDNNTTYTAGSGLNLTGTIFSHAPHTGDVSGTTSLTVTGIQGKMVSNVNPTNQQVLQWDGSQWIPTNPSNLIQAGNGLNYTGNTLNTVWTQSGNNIFNNNTGRVGIGLTAPTGKVTIQGDTSNVLFEVRDKDGNPVFIVYQDSVHVFVSNANSKTNKGTFAVSSKAQTKTGAHTIFRVVPDSIVEIKDSDGLPVFQAFEDSVHVYVNASSNPTKTNKGTFAVSSKAQTKNLSKNFLLVAPDSSRIYTEDAEGGFGVRDYSSGSTTSYMQLTPENYFIGHQAGKNNINGKFNIYLGYESGTQSTNSNYCTFLGYGSGMKNNSSDNTFIGYTSGMFHKSGGGNVFIGSKAGQKDSLGTRNICIGESAGFKNVNGQDNISIGFESGFSNNSGTQNLFIGTKSGYHNISGIQNSFIGTLSGFNNISGEYNIFIGFQSGYNNVNGNCNVFIGKESGFKNKDSHYNTFIGMRAGYSDSVGLYNTMLGCNAGYSLGSGTSNTFIGCNAGLYYNAGSFNTFVGTDCGRGEDGGTPPSPYGGTGNTCLGFSSAYFLDDAQNNTFLGTYSGYKLKKGNNNIFIGFTAGYDHTNCSNLLYIESSADTITPLISGNFATKRIAFNRRANTYPLQVGTNTTNGNGAYLTAGGTWTNASSKSLKDRFETLNKNELFTKIEQLDIKAWYYKGTQERHIGPFAEDFYQAFGTGVLDEPTYLGKSLAAADVAGVSLAAVKELIKEVNLLKKEIDDLKKKNIELEKDLKNQKSSNL